MLLPKRATVALIIAAALLLAVSPAHAAGQGRGLRQAYAKSTSTAVAGPGSTAISNVGSSAVSTGGKPAVAVANGASVADGGRTVITNCNAYARNTVQYRNCINAPGAADAAGAGAASWDAAPRCSGVPTASNSQSDKSGRLWGFQNGVSCGYKDAAGKPLAAASTGTGPGNGSTISATKKRVRYQA